MAVATTNTVLNYSGLIFNSGDVETPILNAISRKNVSAERFAVTCSFSTGKGEQPSISETASMTAPVASINTRKQEFNVTQIFQYSTGVSYKKQSNYNAMSGINVGGQQNSVSDELAFQISDKSQKCRNDIEYTIINGVYQEAIDDDTASKTRGIIAACPATNKVAAASAVLSLNLVVDAMEKIYKAHGKLAGLILLVNPINKRQLTQSIKASGDTQVPASRTMGGIAVEELVTDYGVIGVRMHDYVPAGTAVLCNLGYMKLAEQPVPGKGNFFWEELSKKGAVNDSQLYGQAGLDYGPSWNIACITGLKATFDPADFVAKTTDAK